MNARRVSPVCAWLLVLSLSSAHGDAQTLHLEPCRIPGIDGEVRCGTFSVRENRSDARSRLIPLEVFVLPARSPHPLPDPVFFVSPGGPGTTNSEGFVFAAWRTWMRDRRDIVVVDLRGTSGPSRLDCDMSDPSAPDAQFLETLFPLDRVKRCRVELEKKADLRSYTTTNVVQDFDEVRRALGYRKVNLFAVSWGTRVVYLWLRMHPESVRSAILQGTAPVSFLNPLPHAHTAQNAIDALFAECQRQPPCHAAFPNVALEFDTVVARLQRRPVSVRLATPTPGDSVTVKLTRPEFAEAVRTMTYAPPASQRVPLLVHRAALGDFAEFVQYGIASNRRLRTSLRFGFLLSITCTEDVARIDPRLIERETAHTYLGDTRVREQIAACEAWPRGPLPADYGDPVRSDVPTFLLSGTVDPVAGAALTAEAAKYLSNSVHVVAPGGHTPFGPCIDSMERSFLEAARPKAVDTSCVASMHLPAFEVRSRSDVDHSDRERTQP